MTKTITRDLIEDSLRACDPEPYDGEHEALYYRSFSEHMIAWLAAHDVPVAD